MNFSKALKSSLFAVSIILSSNQLSAAETFIDSSDGISVSQLDFPENSPVVMNSSVGLFEVNLLQLRLSTGIPTGYINVVSGGVWVVRNLQVFPEEDYPYPRIATRFDIGVPAGNAVAQLSADVLYSEEVMFAAVTGTTSTFTVSDRVISQGAIADESTIAGPGATAPPTQKDVFFGPNAALNAHFLVKDHANLESAQNQCYPMAVANTLQNLAHNKGLMLPHKHVAGLKGDESLVGQIGEAMGRTAESRTQGRGVGITAGIEGKLRYLAANNLQDRVRTRTWGLFGADRDHSVTVNGRTAKSSTEGNTILFAEVVAAIEAGQACEAAYVFPEGGHAVALVGAGYVRGQPWIVEASDIDQSSDSKGAGADGFLFSHLVDSDGDGLMNLNGGSKELDFVMCQEYIPAENPPDTNLPPPQIDLAVGNVPTEIISIMDPAGHQSFVDNPPAQIGLDLKSGLLTFQGGASWLPLVLTINGETMSGSNTATVAGFSNISNTITATVNEKTIDATITLGANGGLPQGQPISFDVRLTSEEAWGWIQGVPVPAPLSTSIRANGFRGNFTTSAADPLSIGVSLEPGAQEGTNADWWIVAQSGELTAYYDLAVSNWVIGPLVPSRQEPLASITSETLFRAPGSALPAGEYTFYFGVDTQMNGVLDVESLVFDSVVLTLE